jgi:hypothetical protein
MKKYIKILLCIFVTTCYSQTYYKINGLTALVGVPNIGFETSVGNKLTFQLDVGVSFWKSVNGKPLQFALIFPEIRYHFREKYNGFYAGANVGAGLFKFQKWNYSDTNRYQSGFNYMIGAVVGYEKQLGKHWLIDVYLGGGNSQAFYRGYDLVTKERYDLSNGYNKSAEFIPYRGGVMIGYQF